MFNILSQCYKKYVTLRKDCHCIVKIQYTSQIKPHKCRLPHATHISLWTKNILIIQAHKQCAILVTEICISIYFELYRCRLQIAQTFLVGLIYIDFESMIPLGFQTTSLKFHVPQHSYSLWLVAKNISNGFLYFYKSRMFAYFSIEVIHGYLIAVWHPIHPAITVLLYGCWLRWWQKWRTLCLYITQALWGINLGPIIYPWLSTVRCHYNAVNFTPNPHKRHPWGRYTVECRYNVVQFNNILHKLLKQQRQKINQMHPQMKPHTSP